LYLIVKIMPPKKDGKRPTRAGRNKKEEEEPVDTVPPPSEKEILLKEEYVHIFPICPDNFFFNIYAIKLSVNVICLLNCILLML